MGQLYHHEAAQCFCNGGDAAMSYYMPDKSIYKVNLQLDNDSFPLIKDHDFDWTIDDDAMM